MVQEHTAQRFRIGIDIGGTFTDSCWRDDGHVRNAKVPSTPDDYSRGIATAPSRSSRSSGSTHRRSQASSTRRRSPPTPSSSYKGARTGAPDDRGLPRRAGDAPPAHPGALRPAIREAAAAGAAPASLEVRERIGPRGEVRVPLDEESVASRRGEVFRDADVEAVAISFLHAYANPATSAAVEAILRETARRRRLRDAARPRSCRRSASTSGPRTAVVNAYVGPVDRALRRRALRAGSQRSASSCPSR